MLLFAPINKTKDGTIRSAGYLARDLRIGCPDLRATSFWRGRDIVSGLLLKRNCLINNHQARALLPEFNDFIK